MTKTSAMHRAFASAAANMHYNDELLCEMLEAHAKLAAGDSRCVLDNMLDTLNAEFDANEADGMMQGRELAHAAIEALEAEYVHAAMQLLWIACMQRMMACETAYG